MSKIPIPLAPLPEQQRIADKLDSLLSRVDSCRERLDRVPSILKRFRQSVLAAATSGKLTEDWREENDLQTALQGHERISDFVLQNRRNNWQSSKPYKEPSPAVTPPDFEIPENWSWVTWEMVTEPNESAFKRGPFGSALKKAFFVESGYKVYEQYCPINDDCSFARYYIDERKFEELRAFEVKAGDFLISCSGVTLGRITRVPNEFEPGIINQALLRVRLNEHVIDAVFFTSLFRSPFFQEAIFSNSTGSAIPNVKGVKELKSMPLPLPSLSEQQEIARRISNFMALADRVEASFEAASKRTGRLTASLLAKAFRGELVPQDPNDQPASVLLERIRAAKPEATKRKPKATAK